MGPVSLWSYKYPEIKVFYSGEVLTAEKLNRKFEDIYEIIKRKPAPTFLERTMSFLASICPPLGA
jgi:hypothetical protein